MVPLRARPADLRAEQSAGHRLRRGDRLAGAGTTYEASLVHFPWFERLAVDRRASWWGYYEDTPDHNPILGLMPGTDGWINACGFSGHGVQQAAATGRLIAQEALGETTAIDIGPLRIERFAGTAGPSGAGERLIV